MVVFFVIFLVVKTILGVPITLDIYADDILRSVSVNDVIQKSYWETTVTSRKQKINFEAEPGDTIKIVIENKEEKGGLSGIIKMGEEEYTTQDLNPWTYNVSSVRMLYWNSTNEYLTAKDVFPCDGFICFDVSNIVVQFQRTLPFKIKTKSIKKTIQTLSSLEINVEDLIMSTVQGALTFQKLFFYLISKPTLGNVDEKYNVNQKYMVHGTKILYTNNIVTEGAIDIIKLSGESVTKDSSQEVSVQIGICHSQCNSCEDDFSLTDWSKRCLICTSGYYFFYDNNYITCIKENTQPNGYFLDTVDNMYKKCEDSCSKCSSNVSDTKNPNCFHRAPSKDYVESDDGTKYNKSEEPPRKCDYEYPGTDICFNLTGSESSAKIYPMDSEPSKNPFETSIDFGDCEKMLRKYYYISDSSKIFVVKVNIENDSSYTNDINYKVYDEEGMELDTSICNEIEITYPIINGDVINSAFGKNMSSIVDVYNASDPFFNDVCTSYYDNSSDSDVTIKDRQNDIYQNVSLCADGCSYSSINYTSNTIKCVCRKGKNDTKNTFKKETFYTPLVSSNIIIVKCYNYFTSFRYIKFNIGFWVFLFIIVITIILMILFSIRGPRKILAELNSKKTKEDFMNSHLTLRSRDTSAIFKKIPKANPTFTRRTNLTRASIISANSREYFEKPENEDIHIMKEFFEKPEGDDIMKGFFEDNQEHNKTSNSINITTISRNGKYGGERPLGTSINTTDDYQTLPTVRKNEKTQNFEDRTPQFGGTIIPKKVVKPLKLNNLTDNFLKTNNAETSNNRSISNFDISSNSSSNTYRFTIEGKGAIGGNSKEEMSSDHNLKHRLTFKDDIIHEKVEEHHESSFISTFCQMYRKTQYLPRIFYRRFTSESPELKLSVYIFVIATTFGVNAIFFTDNVLNERYENNGILSLLTQLAKTVYSCLTSVLLTSFGNSTINFYRTIMSISQEVTYQATYLRICKKFIVSVKKKVALAYIVILSVELFFWYYLTIFCSIFSKSQIEWVKGCTSSVFLSILTSIALTFAVSLLKYISIKKNQIVLQRVAVYFEYKVI